MTPLTTLYIAELRKLLKRPMTWVLGLILVGLVFFIYATLTLTLVGPEVIDDLAVTVEGESGAAMDRDSLKESLLLPDGLFMGAGLVQLIVVTLVIVLAAGSIGSEFGWATIRTSLLMGATRTRLLIAKAGALVTYGLAGILSGLLLTIAASWLIGSALGEGTSVTSWLNGSFLLDFVQIVLLTMVAVVLWAVVAGAITIVTRSLAAGLAVALALAFLGGQISVLLGQMGSAGVWLSRALPNAGVDALIVLNSTSPPSYGTGDWIWILGNILVWLIGMSVLAIVTFRRMDTLAA